MIFTLEPTRITGRRIPVNNSSLRKEKANLPNSISILNSKLTTRSTNVSPKKIMKRIRNKLKLNRTTTKTANQFNASQSKNHRYKYRYRMNNEINGKSENNYNSINSREQIIPFTD